MAHGALAQKMSADFIMVVATPAQMLKAWTLAGRYTKDKSDSRIQIIRVMIKPRPINY
jgi:hypothetical protein